MANKGVVMAGNDLLDRVRDELNAALDRETQVRVNYETSLIPQLERDLQAARNAVADLTAERDELLKWKSRSERAWSLVEQAALLTTQAIDTAPGEAPIG